MFSYFDIFFSILFLIYFSFLFFFLASSFFLVFLGKTRVFGYSVAFYLFFFLNFFFSPLRHLTPLIAFPPPFFCSLFVSCLLVLFAEEKDTHADRQTGREVGKGERKDKGCSTVIEQKRCLCCWPRMGSFFFHFFKNWVDGEVSVYLGLETTLGIFLASTYLPFARKPTLQLDFFFFLIILFVSALVYPLSVWVGDRLRRESLTSLFVLCLSPSPCDLCPVTCSYVCAGEGREEKSLEGGAERNSRWGLVVAVTSLPIRHSEIQHSGMRPRALSLLLTLSRTDASAFPPVALEYNLRRQRGSKESKRETERHLPSPPFSFAHTHALYIYIYMVYSLLHFVIYRFLFFFFFFPPFSSTTPHEWSGMIERERKRESKDGDGHNTERSSRPQVPHLLVLIRVFPSPWLFFQLAPTTLIFTFFLFFVSAVAARETEGKEGGGGGTARKTPPPPSPYLPNRYMAQRKTPTSQDTDRRLEMDDGDTTTSTLTYVTNLHIRKGTGKEHQQRVNGQHHSPIRSPSDLVHPVSLLPPYPLPCIGMNSDKALGEGKNKKGHKEFDSASEKRNKIFLSFFRKKKKKTHTHTNNKQIGAMSEPQQRLSSSGSNQYSSTTPPSGVSGPTTTKVGNHLKVKGQHQRAPSVQSSATNGSQSQRGMKSESTVEYSLYSLYTLYSADASSAEVPLSTDRSNSNLNNNNNSRGRRQQGQAPPPAPPRRGKKGSSRGNSSKKKKGGAHRDGAGRDMEDEEDGQLATPSTTTNGDGDTEDSEGDPEFERIERQAREALESIAMKDEDVMIRLPEYLEMLRAYRRECSRRSMYKEAHLVQQVLRNLRLEEEARHIRGLTDHQMTERMRMEDVHREEFRAFHAKWNERIDHFEEAQLEEEIGVLERQNDELLAFHEEMREYNPRVLRFSKALVHSRLKQHTLARQRNYARALLVKEEADDIECSDIERFESTRDTMYGRRERELRRRHQLELAGLKNKVQSRRNFLERSRKKELDEMLQRYINARRELETHQNIVRSKTGTILLKHACNTKTDTSGSQAIIISAESGAFGTTIQQQSVQRAIKDREDDQGHRQEAVEEEEEEEEGPRRDGYDDDDDEEVYQSYSDEDEPSDDRGRRRAEGTDAMCTSESEAKNRAYSGGGVGGVDHDCYTPPNGVGAGSPLEEEEEAEEKDKPAQQERGSGTRYVPPPKHRPQPRTDCYDDDDEDDNDQQPRLHGGTEETHYEEEEAAPYDEIVKRRSTPAQLELHSSSSHSSTIYPPPSLPPFSLPLHCWANVTLYLMIFFFALARRVVRGEGAKSLRLLVEIYRENNNRQTDKKIIRYIKRKRRKGPSQLHSTSQTQPLAEEKEGTRREARREAGERKGKRRDAGNSSMIIMTFFPSFSFAPCSLDHESDSAVQQQNNYLSIYLYIYIYFSRYRPVVMDGLSRSPSPTKETTIDVMLFFFNIPLSLPPSLSLSLSALIFIASSSLSYEDILLLTKAIHNNGNNKEKHKVGGTFFLFVFCLFLPLLFFCLFPIALIALTTNRQAKKESDRTAPHLSHSSFYVWLAAMLSTLFYDDVEADTMLRVPLPGEVRAALRQQRAKAEDEEIRIETAVKQEQDESDEGNNTLASSMSAPQRPRVQAMDLSLPRSDPCAVLHGTLDVPQVGASVLWWTNQRGVVHLLAVNQHATAAASRSSQCRLLPIQLPVTSADDLLTCGLCRQSSGPHHIAVAWITKQLQCGMVCLVLQRESGGGAAASVPTGQLLLQLDRERCVMEADVGAEARRGLGVPDVRRDLSRSSNRLSYIPPPSAPADGEASLPFLSACVLSAVPAAEWGKPDPTAAPPTPGAVYMITNGASLWRICLYVDGRTKYDSFVDNQRQQRRRGGRRGADSPPPSSSSSPPGAPSVCEGLCALLHDVDLLQCPNVQDWDSMKELYHGGAAARAAGTASAPPTGKGSGWLPAFLTGRSKCHVDAAEEVERLLGGGSSGPLHRRRRYLALSAVQDSPGWFALLRWDGLLEFYDGTALPRCEQLLRLQSCRVPYVAAARGRCDEWTLRQWSCWNKTTNTVDIVTLVVAVCEATGEEVDHRVLWTAAPVEEEENENEEVERIALRNCLDLSPPFPGSVLLGCTITSKRGPASTQRLTLLWGTPPTPQQHRRSLAALLQDELPAFARRQQSVLQCLDAAYVGPSGAAGPHLGHHDGGERTPVSWQTYFADGAALRAVHTQEGTSTTAVEEYLDYHRLHAVELETTRLEADDETVPLESVMEAATLRPPARSVAKAQAYTAARIQEMADQLPSKGLRSLHFTPCDAAALDQHRQLRLLGRRRRREGQEEEAGHEGVSPLDVLGVTLEALERHGDGGSIFTAMVSGILCGTVSLAAFSSATAAELHLDPSLVKRYVSAESVKAGLAYALTYDVSASSSSSSSPPRAFFHYSRYYVYHSVSRSLLHRLGFLACLYLGWNGSATGMVGTAADRVSVQLLTAVEYLRAALLAAQAAGPELVTFGGRVAPALLLEMAQRRHQQREEEEETELERGAVIESADRATTTPVEPLDFRDAILGTFLRHDILSDAPEPLLLRALQVALGFYGSGSSSVPPRCVRAGSVWTQHLRHRVPLCEHFLLLQDLEAGRTTRTAESLVPRCRRVMEGIAALVSANQVADVLLLRGLLLTDPTGCTAFSAVRLEELQELILAYPEVAPKLYAVGLLRRLVAPQGQRLYCSPSTASTLLLADFLLVLQCVELLDDEPTQEPSPGTFEAGDGRGAAGTLPSFSAPTLRAGLLELHFDTHLALAQAALFDGEIAHCFHYLENAHRRQKSTAAALLFSQPQQQQQERAMAQAVRTAMQEVCRAEPYDAQVQFLHVIRSMPCCSPQLEELMIDSWASVCHYLFAGTASGGSGGMEQQQRDAALYTLHGFLMERHAFGQCARVLSDLATSLRCSARGRQHAGTVARLTALALHAVELINNDTHGPRRLGQEDDSEEAADREEEAVPPPRDSSKSSSLSSALKHGAALSVRELPWLRLRAYAAHCETLLWGGAESLLGAHTPDAVTDLWITGSPVENAAAAAQALLAQLGSAHLWPEAFRLSMLLADACPRASSLVCVDSSAAACLTARTTAGGLASASPCWVLERWVVHLLGLKEEMSAAAPLDDEDNVGMILGELALKEEWDQLIECCAECSSLENQFQGFHSAVSTALLVDYGRTPATLLNAYRRQDPYSALKTLLRVYTGLQERVAALTSQKKKGETGAEETDGGSYLPRLDSSDTDEDESNGRDTQRLLGAQREEEIRRLERLCCLACVDGAHIACEALEEAEGNRSGCFFTAGVVDGLTLAIQAMQTECQETLQNADETGICGKYMNQLERVLTSQALPLQQGSTQDETNHHHQYPSSSRTTTPHPIPIPILVHNREWRETIREIRYQV
eukprot:gene10967-7612_t